MKSWHIRLLLVFLSVVCMTTAVFSAKSQDWANYGFGLGVGLLLCNYVVQDIHRTRLEIKIEKYHKELLEK